MENCIFCQIVQGKIPCHKIYESDHVLAFLDIAPVNKGHTLIISREHYPTIFELPLELGQELILAMQKVGKSILSALNADGLNIGMNNYEAAGQVVHHAHWHLIPRYKEDGLKLWAQHEYTDAQEMEQFAQKIKAKF